MKRGESLILGIMIGAGFMFLLDPARGRRRRALLRDQIVHRGHEMEDLGVALASRARHARNRARGSLMEARSRLRTEEVADPVVEGRVRSALGRLVSNPGAIQVSAEHGRVTLRGTAPSDEVEALVEGVQNVPGVHDVINRLGKRGNAH